MSQEKFDKEEHERQMSLDQYQILDTPIEEAYDEITTLAAEICKTPIALITFVDHNRQWFKSHFGSQVKETPRELSFCTHAIKNKNTIMIVNDARLDERFKNNPAVQGYPHVIFYAGHPFLSSEGYALGSLCVIDHEPKDLTEDQKKTLEILAHQVTRLLELRLVGIKLREKNEQLEITNQALDKFAGVAVHDIKSPLNSISTVIDLILSEKDEIPPEDLTSYLQMINRSVERMRKIIDGILEYTRCEKVLSDQVEEIDFSLMAEDLKKDVDPLGQYTFIVQNETDRIAVHKIALYRILMNLVTNSIKYNNRDNVKIEIGVKDDKDYYVFWIKDNGNGIAPEQLEKVFNMFEVGVIKDRFGNRGSGIGLATVKKMIESMGGSISIASEVNQGTTVTFSLKKAI